MKSITLMSTALLCTTGLPTFALDFGSGFSATGEAEIEYVDLATGGEGETFSYGSVDLSYQQPGGGFGGFIGVDAYGVFDQSLSALYGAVSYSGDFGKVQIGAPRPALDDYFNVPALGGMRLAELEFSSGKSIVGLFALAPEIDTPVGLRYDGTFGAFKVGASYHTIENVRMVDLAGNYTFGTTVLGAGMERIEESGFDQTLYHIGAETTLGKVRLGAVVTDLATFELTATHVYAVYSPIENLDLTASVLNMDDLIGNGNIYGISAHYTVAYGAYVEAGYIDNSLSDGIYNVSLGVKF